MDKKTITIIILAVLLAAALAGGGVCLWRQNSGGSQTGRAASSQQPSKEQSQQTAPQQKQAEQAAPSAAQNPAPQPGDAEQIRKVLAERHGKNTADTTVTVNSNDGTYAQGLVKFAGEVAGGWWLAVKANDGRWGIIAEGNGTVSCADIAGFNFPASMVPECWDENTMSTVTR